MGPTQSLRPRWDPRGPNRAPPGFVGAHPTAQSPARYARWREGLVVVLKTAQPEALECHGRHEAHSGATARVSSAKRLSRSRS
jgi:hypothetical protein